MTPNLKQFAYTRLRASLLEGKFPIGGTLSPARLAKELGISQTPVREAIVQLECEGFVEQRPRLGHQVKKVDRDELAELFELRLIIEHGAVIRATERITTDEIEDLNRLCDFYRRLVRAWRDAATVDATNEVAARLTRLDAAFHLRLLTTAGNQRLVKVVGDLQLMTFLFRRHIEMPRDLALHRWARSCRDHWLIVRALARRDAQGAGAALMRHLEGAKSYYLDAFDRSQRSAPRGTDADLAWSAELLDRVEQEFTADVGRRQRKHKPK